MDFHKLCFGCFTEEGSQVPCPLCGYSSDNSLEAGLYITPGTLLFGKYLVGKVLGQGGFGITYLGWDTNLDIRIAVKEFFPKGLASRAPGKNSVISYTGETKTQFNFGVESFLLESKILARFENHPNIVTVRDFFKENNTAYMVMSYLEGATLAANLKQGEEKLPVDVTLELVKPVMEALKEVHQAGFMHRDISPDNIFLTKSGQVVLIDFGSARQEIREKTTKLTVILKVGYAPLEQYRSGREQGPWTDIYSLAATIYRCITGQVPPDALDRSAEDNLVPPSQMGVPIDDRVESALMKALAVKWEDRFKTVEEFQTYLFSENKIPLEIDIPVSSLSEEIILQSIKPEYPSNGDSVHSVGEEGEIAGLTEVAANKVEAQEEFGLPPDGDGFVSADRELKKDSKQTVPETGIKCPGCQSYMKADTIFCTKCGVNLKTGKSGVKKTANMLQKPGGLPVSEPKLQYDLKSLFRQPVFIIAILFSIAMITYSGSRLIGGGALLRGEDLTGEALNPVVEESGYLDDEAINTNGAEQPGVPKELEVIERVYDYYVDVDEGTHLFVRQSPGREGKPSDDILGRLPNDHKVEIINSHGNTMFIDNFTWWEISDPLSELSGWVAAEYLQGMALDAGLSADLSNATFKPGIAAVDNEWIYYRSNDNGKIYKIKIDGSNSSKVNDDDSYFINVADKWVYYANRDDGFNIFKVDIDGSRRQKINNDDSTYLNLVGDWIYYINKSDRDRIYKIRKDGTGRELVVDDKAYEMFVAEEWIFYSNYDKGGEIYKVHVSGSNLEKLNDSRSWYLYVDEGWVYYANVDTGYNIYRVSIDGKRIEKVNNDNSYCINVVNGYIYYSNNSDFAKIYKVSTDGSGRKKLNDEISYQLTVAGDWIYYANSEDDYKTYRVKIDGSDRQIVD